MLDCIFVVLMTEQRRGGGGERSVVFKLLNEVMDKQKSSYFVPVVAC